MVTVYRDHTHRDEPVRYRWQRHDDRYYEALLQRDLFGWVVVRVWGRVGSRLGQMMTTPVRSYPAGQDLVRLIARRRAARRYRLMYEDGRCCERF